MLAMMHERQIKQINFRADRETQADLEVIRRLSDPIPNEAEAIRAAIRARRQALEAEALKRKRA
jgi:hypothetical protein